MSFPDDDIDMCCQAAFGADLTADPSTWTWTDLTPRLLRNPITISRGVIVGAATSKSASASVVLSNGDGWLTANLASSPWWPYVDVGTPFQILARQTGVIANDTFTRTTSSGWGVADTGASWQVSGSYLATDGSGATITAASRNVLYNNYILDTHSDIEALFDASVGSVQTGDLARIGPLLRYNSSVTARIWTTVEFGLSGAVQIRARVYTDSNVETVLSTYVLSGVTYTAGTVIRCRVQVQGSAVRMRAWLASGTEPTSWQISATQTTVTAGRSRLGMYTLVPPTSTTTLPVVFRVDNLSFTQMYAPRLRGYISDVQPTFLPNGSGTTWSQVTVSVGGVTTRLEKKSTVAWSPLRRSLQDSASPPYAYWPLEDAQGSTSAASAFPGGLPMTVIGPAVFAFDTGEDDTTRLSAHGCTNLCSLAAGASLSAVVTPAATGAWTVSATIQQITSLVGGSTTEVRLIEWATPQGSYTRWALVCTMTGHTLRAYNDPAGTSTDVIVYADQFGSTVAWDVTAAQDGSNIDLQLLQTSTVAGSTSVAGTLGPITRITVNPDRVNTTASVSPFGIRFLVGHLMVHSTATASALPYYFNGSEVYRADRAWSGEPAHLRISRLCAEENIPYVLAGTPPSGGQTRLGAQQPGAFTDLLSAAGDADSGGLLLESGFGVEHVPRSVRYNTPVALTVDLSTYVRADQTDPATVLVPSLNARGPNVITVQRTGGTSATFAADQVYRDRRGTVTDSKTLDLISDDDPYQHAAWRVHLSVDGNGANYPNVGIDLAANPGLIEQWLPCDIGARIQRINQPSAAGIGVIDQVIDGITETITPRSEGTAPGWTVVLDTSPFAVWNVGTYDSSTSLLDSNSTTLKTAVNASATSLVFRTAVQGDVWLTTTTPYDVLIFGEQVTVTAITSATVVSGAWEQTATVTRAVNTISKSLPAGSEIHVANAAVFAL